MSKGFEYCNATSNVDFDPSEDGATFILAGAKAATYLGRLLSPSSIFPFKAMSGGGREYTYSSFNAHCVSELKRDWSKDTLELVGEQATSQYNLARYNYVADTQGFLYTLSQAWFDFLNTPLQGSKTPGDLIRQLKLSDISEQVKILDELKALQIERGGELTLAMVLHCVKLPVLHGSVIDGIIIPDEAELFFHTGYEKARLRLEFKPGVSKTPSVQSQRRRV